MKLLRSIIVLGILVLCACGGLLSQVGFGHGSSAGSLLAFLLIGSSCVLGVITGFCSEEKQLLALGGAAVMLVFLNSPSWGDFSGLLGSVPWIGYFLSSAWTSLISAIMSVASVSLVSRFLIFSSLEGLFKGNGKSS